MIQKFLWISKANSVSARKKIDVICCDRELFAHLISILPFFIFNSDFILFLVAICPATKLCFLDSYVAKISETSACKLLNQCS